MICLAGAWSSLRTASPLLRMSERYFNFCQFSEWLPSYCYISVQLIQKKVFLNLHISHNALYLCKLWKSRLNLVLSVNDLNNFFFFLDFFCKRKLFPQRCKSCHKVSWFMITVFVLLVVFSGFGGIFSFTTGGS